MRPLVVPPAALRDENSIQMLSGWIAEKGLHCTINIGYFDGQGHKESKAWGIFLADVVRHIANAQNDLTGASASVTIQEIVEAINAELGDASSEASGHFSVRPS